MFEVLYNFNVCSVIKVLLVFFMILRYKFVLLRYGKLISLWFFSKYMYDCIVVYYVLCICIDFLKIRGRFFFILRIFFIIIG